jgi:hypothetical protein
VQAHHSTKRLSLVPAAIAATVLAIAACAAGTAFRPFMHGTVVVSR